MMMQSSHCVTVPQLLIQTQVWPHMLITQHPLIFSLWAYTLNMSISVSAECIVSPHWNPALSSSFCSSTAADFFFFFPFFLCHFHTVYQDFLCDHYFLSVTDVYVSIVMPVVQEVIKWEQAVKILRTIPACQLSTCCVTSKKMATVWIWFIPLHFHSIYWWVSKKR